MSAIESDATKFAADVGVNVTDMEQLDPERRVLPHVFASEKLAAFAPVMPIVETFKVASPKFDNVKF